MLLVYYIFGFIFYNDNLKQKILVGNADEFEFVLERETKLQSPDTNRIENSTLTEIDIGNQKAYSTFNSGQHNDG